VCNDAEPCTSDACTPAFGCTFTAVTGFESISCTFRRGRIEAACGTGLPNQIDGKIRKAKGLIAKATLTQNPVKARKPLKIALRNLKKALRVALGEMCGRGDVPDGNRPGQVVAQVTLHRLHHHGATVAADRFHS